MGLSLREVGRTLDEPGFTPSALVEDLIRRTRERVEAETEPLTRLRRIDAAEPAEWEDVLQVVMVAEGRNDTDAADALSMPAGDTATAEHIATVLLDRLAHVATEAPARGRLTQARPWHPHPSRGRRPHMPSRTCHMKRTVPSR